MDLLQLLVFFSLGCVQEAQAKQTDFKWCYEGACGPSSWKDFYPFCGGSNQSPIDIKDQQTVYKSAGPLTFSRFDQTDGVQYYIHNTDRAVQVDLELSPAAAGAFRISGGHLSSTYQLVQFHFHFGSVNSQGSEHTRNGQQYPMEMHMVAYNTKYNSFSEAAKPSDGLAVIGVFFKVGGYYQRNKHFDVIEDNLDKIPLAGDKHPIELFPLTDLLPKKSEEYYWYKGSLTTPPCYESVQWTMMKHTVAVGGMQLARMRDGILNSQGIELVDNYRPTQPLNGRAVYRNF